MSAPLNPFLYERLRAVFKSVKFSFRGLMMKSRDNPTTVWGSEIRRHLDITQEGEYYLVCCPYCGDTRHRLNVNHMYGKRSNEGRRLNFLAYCFNENCLSKEKNREDFRDLLDATDEDLESSRIYKGKVVDPTKFEARMPGPCRRLDRLPENHHVRAYVRSRHYDPDKLAKNYGVCYCLDSPFLLARRRIIIPIHWKGKLVGWQSRYVGELDWNGPKKKELPPKYWTMPNTPRNAILANFENAKKYRTGVLVEGWFDVFGHGPMAIPILGSSFSALQQRMFAKEFRGEGRSGVLLLDPEEFHKQKTKDLYRELNKRMNGKLANVKLPDKTDPGKLDRRFQRDFVRQEAEKQGVEVWYEKVPT